VDTGRDSQGRWGEPGRRRLALDRDMVGEPCLGEIKKSGGEEATMLCLHPCLRRSKTTNEIGGEVLSMGFERLRYLFWQYLDWRQRLKVLVDVDVLPKTADRPIPQTMERLALDSAARSDVKLHDLWEAIMPLIPAEKRGINPFQSNGSGGRAE